MPRLRHYDHLGTARFVTITCFRRYHYLTDTFARNTVIEELKTIRFELTARGGPVSSKHWVDGSGHVVKSDYNGAMAIRCSKERALAGLHEKIVPRTAGPAPEKTPPEPAKEAPAPK